MLVISMVGITDIEKVKLWISQFILSNSGFEFRSISGNETRSFINDVLAVIKKNEYASQKTQLRKRTSFKLKNARIQNAVNYLK